MSHFEFSKLILCICITVTVQNQQAQARTVKYDVIPAGTCGQTAVPIGNKWNRITGGTDAAIHSMPWIVSLRRASSHFCGGTLLRVHIDQEESDIVVTAAHCVETEPVESPQFDLIIGAHFTSKKVDGEQRIPAAKIIMHPYFDQPPPLNDIALIKLAYPVKFSDAIQPACLPSQDEPVLDGTMGIAAGWGALNDQQDVPKALQQVFVPTYNVDDCKARYANPDMDTEKILCAGFENKDGKGVCAGDSGGPYVIKQDQGYTLHGVPAFIAGCDHTPLPDGYTRVALYVDWIKKEMAAVTSVY